MRYLIVASLLLSCSLCMAEDAPKPAVIKPIPVLDMLKTEKIRIQKEDIETKKKVKSDLTAEKVERINRSIGELLNKERSKSKIQRLNELPIKCRGSIGKDVAQELAKFPGYCLHLYDLYSIDKDVAQELVKFEGKQLRLDRLMPIDKDVAQELAKFKGDRLCLSFRYSINEDAAQELAKFEGGSLSYFCSDRTDPDVIKILETNPKIRFPQSMNDY